MNRKPILWVLAGRMIEFDHFAHSIYSHCDGKERCPYDVRYATDTQRVRGYRDCFYVCEGTWFRKPDAEYLIEIMKHSGFKELGYSDIFGESRSNNSLYHENINPIKVPKDVKIWGQKNIYEFIKEEEMRI